MFDVPSKSAGITDQGAELSALLNGLARILAVLARILIAERGAGTSGAPVHAASPFSAHGRRPARRAGPGAGPAA